VNPTQLKNAEHEVVILKTQLELLKEGDDWKEKLQTHLDRISESQKELGKSLEKLSDYQKDLRGSLSGLESMVDDVSSNQLKDLGTKIQSLSSKQDSLREATSNLNKSLHVSSLQISERIRSLSERSKESKNIPSTTPIETLTKNIPSTTPIETLPKQENTKAEPWRFAFNQTQKVGEEMRIFNSDWNSTIWRESKGVKSQVPLPLHPELMLKSYDYEDPESNPIRFSLDSLRITRGVFLFSLVFPGDTAVTIKCTFGSKACTFWRVLQFNTTKPGQAKFDEYQMTQWSQDELFVSISIKKIKCDWFFEMKVPGREESIRFLEFNNLQFCSNRFAMKLGVENAIGSLQELILSPYHGSCVISSVCQCDEGWTGDFCNIPFAGTQPYNNTYEALFDQLIEDVQYPKDCSTTRALVFSWNRHALGFGNSIHWMLAFFFI